MRPIPAAVLLAAGTIAAADTIHVPGDQPTIQAAIDAAAAGDEIVVAPGVYRELLDLRGKELVLRSSGGRDETVLDGSGLGGTILSAKAGESLGTVIGGFTFRRGEGEFNPVCVGGSRFGGAVYIGRDSALTIEGCGFVENGFDVGVRLGGAIAVFEGSVRVSDSVFLRNGQHSGDPNLGTGFGGAVAICNRYHEGVVEFAGCVFEENFGSHGGAMTVENFGTFSVVGSSFLGNVASHGGGLKVVSDREVVISDCEFIGNSAAFGAGINLAMSNGEFGDPAVARIIGCTFDGNVGGFGGGLMAVASVDIGLPLVDPVIEVAACSFTSNLANGCCDTGLWWTECFQDGQSGDYYGGAANFRTLYGGRIEVANCLAAGNSATFAGGFDVASCGGGEISIVNSTVADNGSSGLHVRAAVAGSYQAGSTVQIANTIAAGNGSGNADQLIAEVEPDPRIDFGVRYSLIEGGFAGSGNIGGNPGFADPAGGDHRLAAGSPAIDAGDNTAVPAGFVTDLAGRPRFVDDPDTADTGVGPAPVVDMGALEFQGGCPADIDGDGDADVNDFFLYLDLFAAGDARADITGDGEIDVNDFFAYLDLFVQGC